jgi:Tfp pilus assembly pilus retraction ATPase PilT
VGHRVILSRFFRDRKGMGAVFRVIPSKIITAEEMGLSKEILDLCFLSKGLVLVTGPFQIPSIMQTAKRIGMCLMNDSFLDLVKKGIVDPREAYVKAVDEQGLLAMFKSNNVDTAWLASIQGSA